MLDSTNRRRCAAAFVAVLLTASFAARASGVADDVADEVRKVEQRRVEALTSRDYATLEKLLGDDLTYTHSNGRFENKTQFLNSLRSGDLEYRLMQHADVQVRPYGDTAVMTGRSRLKVISKAHHLEVPIRFTLLNNRAVTIAIPITIMAFANSHASASGTDSNSDIVR